jgi:hypothetical protein
MQQLFTSCALSIPEYQRAYAWEPPQWEDLWTDVCEGLLNGSDHFLGTVVLRQSEEHRTDALGRVVEVFDVVDGQQRLTTLALLILALFEHLRAQPLGKGMWLDFVEHDGVERLKLGGVNTQYFLSLIAAVRDDRPLPDSPRATNRRMRDGLCFFREKLKAFNELPNVPRPQDFVTFVRDRLHTLRFVTDDAALAIKTFQTINDRGRPLTLLDKTKSLLMFYVTKYLDSAAKTFRHVQDDFGEVYEHFDKAKDLAQTYGVEYLVNPRYRFGEEEILNFAYHYSAVYLIKRYGLSHTYAYSLGAEKVFEDFLRPALQGLRNQPETLKCFVDDFVHDFAAVAQSVSSVLAEIPNRPMLSKLLQRQGLSASVYPLIIGLNASRMLDDHMLEAVAVLDLRVYKVRGTDPRAWLYRSAVSAIRCGASYEEVYNTIIGFTRSWGSDAALDGSLRQGVYQRPYVRFVLWEMATAELGEINTHISQLFSACQVDHILPREPMIDISTCGFASEEEYRREIDRFGNLCLLEQRLNGGAGNKPLADKAGYYVRSDLEATRVLGHMLRETGFRREDIERRVEKIISFFRTRWPIPEGDAASIPEENDEDSWGSTILDQA